MPVFFCPRPVNPQQAHTMDAALDPFLAALFGNPTPSAGAGPAPSRAAAAGSHPKNNRSCRTFTPKFDVFETPTAFHLEGALPGLNDKKAIDIEFSDDRTMLVRGRIDRVVPKAPEKKVEDDAEEPTPVEEKRRSLNPTVEETDDEDDTFSMVRTPSQTSDISRVSSQTSQTQKKVVTAEKKVEQKEETKKEDERKTWVSERTYGNFQRAFSFPTPVDLDCVTATLEAGIVSITVPKMVFKGARKIEIE